MSNSNNTPTVNVGKIKALARDKGLTMKYLSNKLGKPDNFLAHVRAGNMQIVDSDIIFIAERLGTTPEYLTDQTDDPTRQDAPSALDEQLSGIEFALFGEVRGLSDTQKQTILDFARFVKEQGGKQ